MNLEDFKKLSQEEAFAKAGELAGVAPSVFDGIWRTESNRGKTMRSPAGAEGHFQLMPKTRALLEKKLGVAINPDDFHESLFAATHHLKDDLVREKGDVVAALRAYNNGPNWRSKPDARGENAAYAAKVLGDEYKLSPPPRSMKAMAESAVVPRADAPRFVPEPMQYDPTLGKKMVARQQAQQEQEEQAYDAFTFFDAAGTALGNQGVVGALIRNIARPDFEPDANFKVDARVATDLIAQNNWGDDEARILQEARSEKEFTHRVWELKQQDEANREVGARGAAWAIGASLFGGLPEGALTGIGFGKILATAGYGASQAARAGQAGRAVAYATAENVLGNVLTVGAEDAIGGRVSAQDYWMGATLGAVVTPISIPGLRAEANLGAKQRALDSVLGEYRERQDALYREAVTNLGPSAPPAAISKEMDRLETGRVQEVVNSGSGVVAPERRFMTDIDKLMEDEAAIAGPSEARATPGEVRAATRTDMPVTSEAGAPITNPEWVLANMAPAGKGVNEIGRGVDPSTLTTNWDVKMLTGKTVRQEVFDSYGYTAEEIDALRQTPGLYAEKNKVQDPRLIETARWLQQKFLNDVPVVLVEGTGRMKPGVRGDAWRLGGVMFVRVSSMGKGAQNTLVHEMGHLILYSQGRRVSERLMQGLRDAHADWQREYAGVNPETNGVTRAQRAGLGRGAVTSLYTKDWNRASPEDFSTSFFDAVMGFVSTKGELQASHGDKNFGLNYIPNFDEYTAEQFVKYLEAAAADELKFKPSLPQALKDYFVSAWNSLLDLFRFAKEKELIAPDERVQDFFKGVWDANKAYATKMKQAATGQVFPQRRNVPEEVVAASNSQATPGGLAWLSDPVAVKYGLDKLPVDTPVQRAEAKAMIELYRKADDPKAVWNNLDPKALDRWFKNDAFDAVKSTSLRMLQSENPIMRMVAAELLESPSGAAGRRSTAAIKKFMLERQFMGRVQLDFDNAYIEYRNSVGAGIVDDHLNQDALRRFNKLVAEEIESRNLGVQSSAPVSVVKAADALEQVYERMAVAQKNAKTIGWAGLPDSSKGYMPHRMSAEAVRNMTRGQENALYNSLVDQFVMIEGWDMSFADKLAAKYIDRVRQRGLGGYDAKTGVTQTGAADIVEDALKAMGMSQDEIRANMQKFMRGAAGHTKRRIRLDLLKEYTDEDGSTFRLIDFFETDQMNLVRQQAQRVSGEVALTEYGIMGRPGMLLIRRAAEFGYPGQGRLAGNADEVNAFDQVMAEFLGDPFGNHQSRNLDRVMMFTTLSRLGGVVWNQIAETINIATTLGVGHAFKAIGDMPRMAGELRRMIKGEKVDGILSGIETWGYAPGMDHYRMNFPYESHTGQNTVLGRDSLNAADRLLRSGLNLQAKLTGWRLMTAVQERAATEQIVLKALRYIRDGGEDAALRDMGFGPDVVAAVKAEFPNIVQQDASGKFVGFDIQKMQNVTAAEDFVQAVHRGAKQIIQGTYIGETGKWAHDGWLKLLTQFKTFSLIAVEKQWGRNVSNYGMVKAMAILLASMSAAAPIYMARMAVQAQGRPDKEKYLEERLRPEMIARATLNYVASSGMAGELMDALSSLSGVGQVTGGRAGAETGFVGSVVAPAAGVVDDVWKSVQNSKDGTNVHAVAKNLPFANAPFLVPVMNTLRPEE